MTSAQRSSRVRRLAVRSSLFCAARPVQPSTALDRNLGRCLLLGLRERDPDLEDALPVACFDVALRGALWQPDATREAAVVELGVVAARALLLLALLAARLHVQVPVADLDLDVLLR